MEALMSSRGYSLTEDVDKLSSLMDDVYKEKGLTVAPTDGQDKPIRSNSIGFDSIRNVREY